MRLRVALTALVCVLPLWTTPAVPTQDGPSHVYNAWVISNLADPELGLSRHFELVPWAPNWGGVGPLVPLLGVLPPLVAEKVFLSLLVVAFVLGAQTLSARCGGDALIAAALSGVLAHGLLFVMGFSGYLLALAAGFFLAASAGSPDPPPWARLCGAGAAFAALFFVHLLGALVAAGLWLLVVAAPLLDRMALKPVLRRASPVLALAPLLVWQLRRDIPPAFPPYRDDPRGPWGRLVEIADGFHWQALADRDRIAGLALTVLLLALLALGGRRGSQAPATARALALGAVAALLAFLFVPWASGGGALLPERFVPLVFLLPLAWATSGELPGHRYWRAAAFGLLGFAVVLRGAQYREWGLLSLKLARERAPIAPGTLLVAAHRIDAGSVANPLFHVWGRLALETRAVALDDYEAAMPRGLFPVAFRPDTLQLAWRSRSDIGAQPEPGVRVFGWEIGR